MDWLGKRMGRGGGLAVSCKGERTGDVKAAGGGVLQVRGEGCSGGWG